MTSHSIAAEAAQQPGVRAPDTRGGGLLRVAPPVANFASRLFYRLTISGPPVPASGPVLLVANHPNSILDPLVLIAGVRRPVRFLATATLFRNPVFRRVLNGAGVIPVYRRMDDPSLMDRNQDAFGAAYEALARGAAVGIFPEGISHHQPALVELRTGAARITLGAALHAGTFPIVPVGLVFESKQQFRSRAHVAIGAPVSWDDLSARDAADTQAVRELTHRIDEALRGLTINYQQWEDAPLIRAATDIYSAEARDRPQPDADVSWRSRSAVALATLRRSGDADAAVLARDISRHARILRVLGITPHDLHRSIEARAAAGWLVRRVPAGVIVGVVVLAAAVVFWIPYRVTRVVAERYATGPANLATCKVFFGIGIFAVWILALAAAAGLAFGWLAALVAIVLLPALVLETLSYLAPWYSGVREVRSFVSLRMRRDRLGELRERQHELARRLRMLRRRFRRSAGTGLSAAN